MQRSALDLAGLMIDGVTNQVANFVGISLVQRRRLLVPTPKAIWQGPGWIWIDVGPGGVARASAHT